MELIGHKKIFDALTRRGRAAFPQTLLFVGSSGVGKRTVATACASWLVGCVPLDAATHPRIVRVGTTAHRISVEDIRSLMPLFYVRHTEPFVVIVEQAELLTGESGNALLKIMEEPIQNLYFMVIAHSPESVLPTIRSRAAVVRCAPVARAELRAALHRETQDAALCEAACAFSEGRPGVALRYIRDEAFRARIETERARFDCVRAARTIREAHETIAELVGKKEDHTTARADIVEILRWWLLWLKIESPGHPALLHITTTIGELSENMHPRLLMERVVIALKA